ncbi:MAG TPA: ATP-binding cassette domain-containing protein [Rhodothermales bacterium]|nr:ATP-binding cassette domain-containing protein [Rhodothermales bacterium]
MDPSAPLAIEAVGLVKCFGDTRAVDGLDLRVQAGTIYGMLGPNGAGKTTTVRLLATLLRPDAGKATVLGYDLAQEPEEIRRRISLTGQFATVDEDLTGAENLILLGRLLGLPKPKERAAELLGAFDLGETAKRQVKTYSGGQRRRLDVAASLLYTPDLLFLDEPTTGLDPRSRGEVWEIIRLLVAEGTTVLLTTQYLEEADQLAGRIVVVDHGRVIAEGTSAELKASVGTGVLRVRLDDADDRDRARALLAEAAGVTIHEEADPRALMAQVSDPDLAARALAALTAAGVGVSDFSLGQPSLDEVFFALTGHPADAATADAPPTR